MSASTPSFEQGPIRPPSEAHSLLVRVIRNRAWNRCTFCPAYKGSKASCGRSRTCSRTSTPWPPLRRGAARTGHRRRPRRPCAGGGLPSCALPAGGRPRGVPAGRRPLRREAGETGGRAPAGGGGVPAVDRVTTYGRQRRLARAHGGTACAARRRWADQSASGSRVGRRRGPHGDRQGLHERRPDRRRRERRCAGPSSASTCWGLGGREASCGTSRAPPA